MACLALKQPRLASLHFSRVHARARALPMRPSFFALFRRARFTIVSIIIIEVVIIIIMIIIIIIIIITTIMHTPTPLHIERHACAPQHER